MPSSLSQLGRVPPQVHPAMMHLARQQQERGIMLPQNAFSQGKASINFIDQEYDVQSNIILIIQ